MALHVESMAAAGDELAGWADAAGGPRVGGGTEGESADHVSECVTRPEAGSQIGPAGKHG